MLAKISVSLRNPNDEYYSEKFKASQTLDYENYPNQVSMSMTKAHHRGPDQQTSIDPSP